jgi:hypothetical protein
MKKLINEWRRFLAEEEDPDIVLGDKLFRLKNDLAEYGTWDMEQFLWQVKRELNLKQDETELYNLYMQAVKRNLRSK